MNWPTQLYLADQMGEVSDSHYDSFFWKKKGEKKPKKTEEQKAASKEKRKQFWGKVGQGVQDAGGAEGILGTVTNVFSFLKGGSADTGQYDYEMNMGHSEDGQQNQQKKGVPTAVWIVGGIAVLAIGGYLYTQNQKKQAALLTTTGQ